FPAGDGTAICEARADRTDLWTLQGVDERVAEHLATDEISIGDFVLSGGELAAALVVDAVTRLIPGALGNEDSAVNESFSEPAASAVANVQLPGTPDGRGILDYP